MKIKITRSDGTVIEMEGAADEVQKAATALMPALPLALAPVPLLPNVNACGAVVPWNGGQVVR